jgi:hypothetical protein
MTTFLEKFFYRFKWGQSLSTAGFWSVALYGTLTMELHASPRSAAYVCGAVCLVLWGVFWCNPSAAKWAEDAKNDPEIASAVQETREQIEARVKAELQKHWKAAEGAIKAKAEEEAKANVAAALKALGLHSAIAAPKPEEEQ